MLDKIIDDEPVCMYVCVCVCVYVCVCVCVCVLRILITKYKILLFF
jgi:hypothetical protein